MNVILEGRKKIHILDVGVWDKHTLCGRYAGTDNSTVIDIPFDCKRCTEIAKWKIS